MKLPSNPRDEEILLSLLRQVRIDAGFTQETLAEKLNVTQSWVSGCERGSRRLEILQIRRICNAIGMTLTEFAAMLDKALEEG
jgi:transcriptional regulator with XRE-family HTH domain